MSTELAWAAGFFDGEGCVSLQKNNGKTSTAMLVSICQVDIRPLERFVRAVGMGKINGPYQQSTRPRQKPIHQLRFAQRDSKKLMELLWPYLSEPKREQCMRSWHQTTAYQKAQGRSVQDVAS